MGNRNKAKGTRREHEVMDILESRDYDTLRGGGSLGIFDIWAIPNHPDAEVIDSNRDFFRSMGRSIKIQVKSNRIDGFELDRIVLHDTVARKEVWIKKDYKPWMKAVIDE